MNTHLRAALCFGLVIAGLGAAVRFRIAAYILIAVCLVALYFAIYMVIESYHREGR